MKRRTFLQTTALALPAAALPSQMLMTEMLKKKSKLGIQLFSIPQMVAKDMPGTLKLLAETGYREIEFFGPFDFSAPETIEGWKPLAQMLGIQSNAFYGKSISEVKKILQDLDLSTPSIHLDLITLQKNMDGLLKAIEPLGVKYVVIPALQPEQRPNLDAYKRLIEAFNGFGKQLSKIGASFGYHNHGFEHAPMDGVIPMDLLLQETDPAHVKFELDIFWMTAAGGDPKTYLQKHPGRYKMLHIKDAAEPIRFSGDGGTSDQWMALFNKMADPGKGVLDIKGILKAAHKSGVEHFYLERDLAPDPMTTLKDSAAFLRKKV